MKNNKYIRKGIWLFSLVIFSTAICFNSCTLDEEVDDFYNADNFFNNAEQTNAAITAIYDGLQSNYGSNNVIGIFGTMSDEMRSRGYNITTFYPYSQLLYSPLESKLDDIYSRFYNGVRDANFCINGIKEEVVGDQYKPLVAEARFLRAFYYTMLLRGWGPVVISEILPEDPFETPGPRNNVEEVVEFILSDLEFAASNLPETSTNGRPDKWAAMGLKARTHLWLASCARNDVYYYENISDEVMTANYDSVITLCKNIKDLSGYSLYDDYSNLWIKDNYPVEQGSGNKEHMFYINYNYSGNANEGSLWGSLFTEYSANSAPIWDVTNGRNVLLGVGWSELYPELEFWKKYEGASTNNPQDFVSGDQRRWKAFVLQYRRVNSDATIQNVAAGKMNTTAMNTFFNFNKYAGQGMENSYKGDAKIPVLRYADVLLMLAEAANERNMTELSKECMNIVRKRAYGDESGNFPNSNLLETDDQDGLRDAIIEERGKELVAEINRWFDLVRTKTMKEVLTNTPTIIIRSQIEDKHYFLPIPTNALIANKNIEQSIPWQ